MAEVQNFKLDAIPSAEVPIGTLRQGEERVPLVALYIIDCTVRTLENSVELRPTGEFVTRVSSRVVVDPALPTAFAA